MEAGSMETLTDAMARLRADGYRIDFSATDGGQLRCGACGVRGNPEAMAIHATVRFEGDSNPDDEAILLALACACGCLGQYSAAFGPDTPADDAEVLRRLAGPRTSAPQPTGDRRPTPTTAAPEEGRGS